jgi:hypothetical protein
VLEESTSCPRALFGKGLGDCATFSDVQPPCGVQGCFGTVHAVAGQAAPPRWRPRQPSRRSLKIDSLSAAGCIPPGVRALTLDDPGVRALTLDDRAHGQPPVSRSH